MNETLEITTEQINDLPLLLGIVEAMGIHQAIDAQIRPHGLCWPFSASARPITKYYRLNEPRVCL
jgi:hypothetical protein